MFTKASLVFSLCASCAYGAFVPPKRLDVPIILGAGGRPMMSVSMGTEGVGKLQHFNFTLTTSLGYTAVANKGCGNCSDVPTYDQSLSPDARTLSGSPAMSLGSGSFGGSLGKENCSLATSSGEAWPYTNQTIVFMDNQTNSSPFGSGVSGLLGLGTLKKPTTAAGFPATFDDGIYGQYYIRNPDAQNFTYGMALKPSPVIPGIADQLRIPPNAKPLVNSDAGIIHWLAPDPSSYQADQMVWRTAETGVTSGYLSGNDQPDLTVSLDGWAATSGGNSVGSTNSILVNIDPYYSGIYMPGSQARRFHDSIDGSQQVQMSTIPGATTAWEVPCDARVTFTVHIGSQQFSVDESLLVVDQGNGKCISLVEGFIDDSVTQYIFGQNWLSALYVIFNIPKNGDPAIAFAPRTVSSTKSRDIGAIVGGTVGGVAGVIALGLLTFFLIRRRQDNTFFKRAQEFEEEHKAASTVEPYTVGQVAPGHQSEYISGSVIGSGTGVISPYGSPPISPHAPLLDGGDHHAQQLQMPPPSYEEASESGVSSPTARTFPREKMGYRQDTMTTVSNAGPSASGPPPSSPDRSEFSQSATDKV